MGDAPTKLRPYRVSDFEILYQVDQLCYPPGISYDHMDMAHYLGAPGAFCAVAEVGQTVAGFIITHRRRTVGYVVTIDVLENFRRMRIGTELLAAAEANAALHGVNRMDLETATNNHAAIAFWKRHGYREFGIVKDYYGQGLDAFEMQKNLSAPAKSKPHRP
jgi:[ribosomal protein S18]-alanine N-acetyltransferase